MTLFPELRAALKAIQDPNANMLDAAIAVATVLRQKVRAGRRAISRRRREERKLLRASGLSAKEARAQLGAGRRKGSGISIDATSTGDAVRLTASSQVQHLRRVQGETPDIVEAFKKYMSIGERWRKARGL